MDALATGGGAASPRPPLSLALASLAAIQSLHVSRRAEGSQY